MSGCVDMKKGREQLEEEGSWSVLLLVVSSILDWSPGETWARDKDVRVITMYEKCED